MLEYQKELREFVRQGLKEPTDAETGKGQIVSDLTNVWPWELSCAWCVYIRLMPFGLRCSVEDFYKFIQETP